MSKVKLTEAQIGMIQKRIEDLDKKKVLKVNEGQYDRLFKGGFNSASKSISKSLKKGGIKEGEDEPEINQLEFAQELIVFIKDVLANPKVVPFSTYWENLNITRKELFLMIKKEGLLTMMVDETNVNTYKAKKIGFRKGVKELYNKITDSQLTEDGGYPAGAEHDPRAPYNQTDSEFDDGDSEYGEGTGVKAKVINLVPVYYNENSDDLMIFKHNNELYAFISSTVDADDFNEFMDFEGIIDKEAIKQYINVGFNKPEGDESRMVVYGNPDMLSKGELVKIGPEVKDKLIGWYGDDGEMVNLLNQLPESTGAASSGSFVGAMSGGPIKKDTGMSPEQAMQDISEVIDAEGVAPFHSERSGEGRFLIDGVEWQYCNVTNNGKVELGVYRYGQDIAYTYDWFNRNILKNVGETTSMGGAGGINVGNGGDSIEHDVNAFGSNNFMKAGNKLNKEETMPMIKRSIDESLEANELSKYIEEAINSVDASLSYQDFAIAVANVIKNSYGQHLIKPFLKVVTAQLGQSNNHLGMNEDMNLSEPRSGFKLEGDDKLNQEYLQLLNQMKNATSSEESKMIASRIMDFGKKNGLNIPRSMFMGDTPEVKVGQIYTNGHGRAKIEKVNGEVMQVRRWGDSPAKTINLGVTELGGWTLLEGKKVLKVTESQMKALVKTTPDN